MTRAQESISAAHTLAARYSQAVHPLHAVVRQVAERGPQEVLAWLATSALLVGCGAEVPPPQFGTQVELPKPQRGLLPEMDIANPAAWGDQRPTVPQGHTVTAIATDLQIPLQTLLLPNGDILVAEGKGGNAPSVTPKDVIAGLQRSINAVLHPKGTWMA
ncbi:hypothetical protein [Ramlibacter rhizophilus]|uniref:hypothetical protein n=1 Tax=Ramlibacter rhizophilus TaxID=1781167 RepID=UPI001F0FDF21|nr:hypothetical protein [Ramlibacter rhizophilus]